jgi:Multicopper oxidase
LGFSIAGHKLQIVQVDGGSWIDPYEVDYVLVHAGIIVSFKSSSQDNVMPLL